MSYEIGKVELKFNKIQSHHQNFLEGREVTPYLMTWFMTDMYDSFCYLNNKHAINLFLMDGSDNWVPKVNILKLIEIQNQTQLQEDECGIVKVISHFKLIR